MSSIFLIVDEVTDLVWGGGARPVLRSRHDIWHYVIPEHVEVVVRTTVENTQLIVPAATGCLQIFLG